MRLFIWDMHGTLETGNERLVVDISNKVLAIFGYSERLSYQDGQHLYGRKWHEYFTWLLGSGSHDQDTALEQACIRLMNQDPHIYEGRIEPTPHALQVLGTIRTRHKQILISNARRETLKRFVQSLGYEGFFSPANTFAVNGSDGRVPRSKDAALASYLSHTADSYEEIVIIGDSPEDMSLKAVAGGTTYLFAHPGAEFRECSADYRIRDLRQVLSHA